MVEVNVIFLFLFIILVAYIGYVMALLTISGAIAAVIVGAGVGLGFGMKGLFILGFFFASSSLFSVYRKKAKNILNQKHTKGSRRDGVQVFANGGVAAAIGFAAAFSDSSFWLIAFFIAIGSATSDTWASEIGTLSKKQPIFIRTLRRIEKGTSGAVSPLGTFAALAGALSIGLISSMLFSLDLIDILMITFFAFFGNVVDTLIGAFIQAAYKCKKCSIETEKMVHCDEKTILVRGLTFMNNDMVNFLSSVVAVLCGTLLYSIL